MLPHEFEADDKIPFHCKHCGDPKSFEVHYYVDLVAVEAANGTVYCVNQQWADPLPGGFEIVHAVVDRIYLQRDGAGPMGMYDRVHIHDSEDEHIVLPAHSTKGWKLRK